MYGPREHRLQSKAGTVSAGAGLGLQNKPGGAGEPKKEDLYAFRRETHALQGRGNKEKNCL